MGIRFIGDAGVDNGKKYQGLLLEDLEKYDFPEQSNSVLGKPVKVLQ